MGKKRQNETIIERVENSIDDWNDADYVREKIRQCITEYTLDPFHEINTDINKITQLQFDAIMMYINRTILCYGDVLKDNSQLYNIDRVYILSLIYIELSSTYNKTVSIVGFSYLSGIDTSTLYEWLNNNIVNGNKFGELNVKRNTITKKIIEARENALKGKLTSTGQAVGILGVGNNEFGWSSDTIAKEERARAIALNELPKVSELSQNRKQFKLEKLQ